MIWESLLSNQRYGEKAREHQPGRSAFEQDFDRIVFSYPFRRLQDKTQVHPLPEHDFVHTRLTHSLEVSSVGRSLGKRVGEEVIKSNSKLNDHFSAHDFGAIVAAASLAHDIGNPPFGHSGEDAISEFFKYGKGTHFKNKVTAIEWADLTTFEGNAQGFRILNKSGIKLTYAALAAFSKYPRQSIIDKRDKGRRSQKKYGFFQSEKIIFENIASETGLKKLGDSTWTRHPLAFLVEAADDICYHLIDLEDGCRLGLVSYDQTVELFQNILKDKFDREKLEKIDTINERIGVLRAMAVGQLVNECSSHFLKNEDAIISGDYDVSLTDDIPSADVLSQVIKISIDKIYRSKNVIETEAAGFEVLPGLLEVFTEAAVQLFEKKSTTKKTEALKRLLPQDILLSIENEHQTLYEVLLSCVDFVSGLTDRHAISIYRKIKGISLPNA